MNKIQCKCKCGKELEEKDKYGRKREYISGHNGRKYEDPKQHKREWNHRNRSARQKIKAEYHRKRKIKALEYKGNKCNNCNLKYNKKNAALFHFHHKNPKTKLFAVGNNMVNKAWKTILLELDKCIILCANCHELHHSSEF